MARKQGCWAYMRTYTAFSSLETGPAQASLVYPLLLQHCLRHPLTRQRCLKHFIDGPQWTRKRRSVAFARMPSSSLSTYRSGPSLVWTTNHGRRAPASAGSRWCLRVCTLSTAGETAEEDIAEAGRAYPSGDNAYSKVPCAVSNSRLLTPLCPGFVLPELRIPTRPLARLDPDPAYFGFSALAR